MRAIYISAILAPISVFQPVLAKPADEADATYLSGTRSHSITATVPLIERGEAFRAQIPYIAPDLTKTDISANSRKMFGLLPEPSTWFSMIAGFTLVGAAVRKVRRDNNI